MRKVSSIGTHIVFTGGDYEGEIATTVYNGLDGVGVKIGKHYPPLEDFDGTTGGLFADSKPEDWPWRPDVMLRKPYEYADLPCCNKWEYLDDFAMEGK